jgi:hypothetical protein
MHALTTASKSSAYKENYVMPDTSTTGLPCLETIQSDIYGFFQASQAAHYLRSFLKWLV